MHSIMGSLKKKKDETQLEIDTQYTALCYSNKEMTCMRKRRGISWDLRLLVISVFSSSAKGWFLLAMLSEAESESEA